MNKLFIMGFIILLSAGFVYAEVTVSTITGVADSSVISDDDTLKADWLGIYNDSNFALYLDVDPGDSCQVYIYYALSPDAIGPEDNTTEGYIKGGTNGSYVYTLLDSIISGNSVNSGKIYYSLNYPATTAISVARTLQFIFISGTTHDSLTFDAAPKLAKWRSYK